MIAGIGIDATEVKRFTKWHTYSKAKLEKVLSDHEIDYCLSISKKSAERFAVRFAAKEAFFKAVQYLLKQEIPLLTVCKAVTIVASDDKPPHLTVNWKLLHLSDNSSLRTHLSLSHTDTTAIAIVILEKD